MQLITQTYPATQSAIGTFGFSNFARRTMTTLISWQGRARQRRALSRLDGHLLEDIGVSVSVAHQEATKPVWVD